MAVKVNSVGKGVEISWDPMVESGPPPATVRPPEFPAHPIELPPEGGGDAHPEHPIFLPPYIDNSLPGGGLGIWGPTDPRPDQGLPEDQPRPEHPIELPPDIEEARDKLKEFLTGNLPDYVAPTGGKQIAVQIFAQGQDGDWSNTAVQPNDGLALLRYPEGFSGESYVEVRGLDGSLVDSGTITVG